MRLSAAPVVPTVPVTDLARARQFYEQKLGLKVIKETEGALAVAAGDTVLYLYRRPKAPSKHTLASFMVDDLAGTVRALRRAGVQFEEYDLPGLRTKNGIADTTEGKGAWFKDQDGNILGVGEQTEEWFPTRRGALGSVEEEANRATVRRLWRLSADPANLDEVAAVYARNVKYHGFGGVEVKGREAVREMIAGYHEAFTGMRIRVRDVVASGDRTVTRVEFTGTHSGEFEGTPATGRQVTTEGITISRWKDGEIVEEWEGFDMARVAEQIGS